MTQTETFTLAARDSHAIDVHLWSPATARPRAILHVCHGMAEHGGRYGELARYLTQSGWLVAAHDHRGHGERSRDQDDTLPGHYADRDGWAKVTDDVGVVQDALRSRYPATPIVLMGHSMGSLIVQGYLVREPVFWPDAVILSGASRDPRARLKLLRQIARFERWRLGRRTVSPLINKLTFGAFSKSVGNPATDFDWLSRDPAQVRTYIDDPRCGFDCTTGLWSDLVEGLLEITARDSFDRWPDRLPIYIFSGGRDPVGGFGKGPRRLAAALESAGQRAVTTKIYPAMRHEPLHETDRDTVMADLRQWLEARIPFADSNRANTHNETIG